MHYKCGAVWLVIFYHWNIFTWQKVCIASVYGLTSLFNNWDIYFVSCTYTFPLYPLTCYSWNTQNQHKTLTKKTTLTNTTYTRYTQSFTHFHICCRIYFGELKPKCHLLCTVIYGIYKYIYFVILLCAKTWQS